MIQEYENCCSCQACSSICPYGCITFVDGIMNIDIINCINCGLCQSACQMEHTPSLSSGIILAASRTDEELLRNSTSGGLASLIIEYCLENDYCVFSTTGVDNIPLIKKIEISNIDAVRCSKYVYSEVGSSFRECKSVVELKRKVLFIGVPCQIAGLKLFLKKDYSNLTTIDILCHGAPSIKIYKFHLKYLEEKFHSSIRNIQFRSKAFGKWGEYILGVTFINGKKYTCPAVCDPYYGSFVKGSSFRKCCYECKYTRRERVGDISLGDFWGIRNYTDMFDGLNGVSSVLVNTQNGFDLWDTIKNETLYKEMGYDILSEGTHAVVAPVSPSVSYSDFSNMNYIDYKKWAISYEHQPTIIAHKIKNLIRSH